MKPPSKVEIQKYCWEKVIYEHFSRRGKYDHHLGTGFSAKKKVKKKQEFNKATSKGDLGDGTERCNSIYIYVIGVNISLHAVHCASRRHRLGSMAISRKLDSAFNGAHISRIVALSLLAIFSK